MHIYMQVRTQDQVFQVHGGRAHIGTYSPSHDQVTSNLSISRFQAFQVFQVKIQVTSKSNWLYMHEQDIKNLVELGRVR